MDTVISVQLNQSDVLIEWSDGHKCSNIARDLRLNCQCAECGEEWSHKKLLDPISVPNDLVAEDFMHVGKYAIQFLWSDGHYTGIYPFDLLATLCNCKDRKIKH